MIKLFDIIIKFSGFFFTQHKYKQHGELLKVQLVHPAYVSAPKYMYGLFIWATPTQRAGSWKRDWNSCDSYNKQAVHLILVSVDSVESASEVQMQLFIAVMQFLGYYSILACCLIHCWCIHLRRVWMKKQSPLHVYRTIDVYSLIPRLPRLKLVLLPTNIIRLIQYLIAKLPGEWYT